ncbi:glycosyltransferase family 2 protein [Enterococcus sp. AZ163]|uniref:glycosyltransferase family 2 protein n=1 Tax=Enterococcus sp. AZ163 TaxID=2774638 RepID=UPI003D27DD6E
MEQLLFSIIIPIYNAENNISKMIKRLKKIDGEDYEIILVNDGSFDRTRQILENLTIKDKRFHVFTTKNQGPGLARNYGLKRSSGKYILFFDSDDTLNENILEDYRELLKKNPDTDLIISSFTFRSRSEERIVSEKNYVVEGKKYTTQQDFFDDIYYLMNKQMMYVVWNKCYRNDLIANKNIQFENYQSCEDRIFNLEYFKHCERVVLNKKIEYFYEFDGGKGITNKYHDKKFESFKKFYKLTNQILEERNEEGVASLFLKGVTSVLFSIIQNDEFSTTQKKEILQKILDDEDILKAKRIAIADTKIKRLTKFLYNSPSTVFVALLHIGSFVETKMPGIMAFFKRVY